MTHTVRKQHVDLILSKLVLKVFGKAPSRALHEKAVIS